MNALQSTLLVILLVWTAYCIDFQDEDSGSGGRHDTLAMFEELLSDMNNTNLLIMVDVSGATTQFLDKLKEISTKAIVCMKRFVENSNSIGVMTFAYNTSLIINFDDYSCIEDKACLVKRGKEINQLKEKRNLKKALRRARQLLSKQKPNNSSRRQMMLLITFGVDMVKDSSPINTRNQYITEKFSKKLAADNITLAVVGVGEKAIANKEFFKKLLKPQPQQYLLTSKEGNILEVLKLATFSCNYNPFDLGGGFGGYGEKDFSYLDGK